MESNIILVAIVVFICLMALIWYINKEKKIATNNDDSDKYTIVDLSEKELYKKNQKIKNNTPQQQRLTVAFSDKNKSYTPTKLEDLHAIYLDVKDNKQYITGKEILKCIAERKLVEGRDKTFVKKYNNNILYVLDNDNSENQQGLAKSFLENKTKKFSCLFFIISFKHIKDFYNKNHNFSGEIDFYQEMLKDAGFFAKTLEAVLYQYPSNKAFSEALLKIDQEDFREKYLNYIRKDT